MTKRKRPTQSSSIAALIKAAKAGVWRLRGKGSTWIQVALKHDRSAVIITTWVEGEEHAYIVMDGAQLDELLRLLETTRKELTT